MDYRTLQILEQYNNVIADIRTEILDVKRELSDINSRLDSIIACMSTNSEKVGSVSDTVQGLKVSTDKMSSHIDFVNNIYEHVRNPLSMLTGQPLSPPEITFIQ